jgi:hypothetical protein
MRLDSADNLAGLRRKGLDHEESGSNRSISISMFRKIEIDVMNVIDFKMFEQDASGKPAQRSTMPRPARGPHPAWTPASATGIRKINEPKPISNTIGSDGARGENGVLGRAGCLSPFSNAQDIALLPSHL